MPAGAWDARSLGVELLTARERSRRDAAFAAELDLHNRERQALEKP